MYHSIILIKISSQVMENYDEKKYIMPRMCPQFRFCMRNSNECVVRLGGTSIRGVLKA